MRTISRADAASCSRLFRRPARTTIAAFAVILLAAPGANAVEVQVCTDRGPFKIELFEEEAPLHTANFLAYVKQGFYTGTAIHRVIKGAIVQGGGFDRALHRRVTREPVADESDNGLKNARGTIAAARSGDPDSATSQYFVNLADNDELDGSSRNPGYTVFGRVTEGMDVLDAIGSLPTGGAGPLTEDVPMPLVVVSSMTIVDQATPDAAQPTAAEPTAAAPTSAVPAEPEMPVRERLAKAREAGDYATMLATIDALRLGCAQMKPELLVLEAEAAIEVGEQARAGYVLNEYFAVTDASDPSLPMAQSLYRRLPPLDQAGIGPLVAHCALPKPPDIPDGHDSDRDTMLGAQAAVQHFMELSDAYLDCLSEVIDDGSLNDAQEVAVVGRHNDTVDLMENIAEAFNRQVRAFRARED